VRLLVPLLENSFDPIEQHERRWILQCSFLSFGWQALVPYQVGSWSCSAALARSKARQRCNRRAAFVEISLTSLARSMVGPIMNLGRLFLGVSVAIGQSHLDMAQRVASSAVGV
jgi:hypothetical protein